MQALAPITASATLITPVRNTNLRKIVLCPAAATSVVEVFDGAIGTIATKAIGAAGSGYTALDVVTLVAAGGGSQATMRIDTVDGSGAVTAFTILSGGTGYTAGSTYATTGGTGTGFTVTASTVTDAGTSIGKITAVANESPPALDFDEPGLLTKNGISARISGSAAKAYVYID